MQQDDFKQTPISIDDISAVVLAGGQGKRLGYQQKALVEYKGKPLIEWVLQALDPRIKNRWLNVNHAFSNYEVYSKKLYQDQQKGFLGPLSGMASAFDFCETEWVWFVPCDNPDIPTNLLSKLLEAHHANPAQLVVAFDGERIQPLYCLLHRSLQVPLQEAIEKGHLSVIRWIKERPHALADFSAEPHSCFANMNTLFQLNDSLEES